MQRAGPVFEGLTTKVECSQVANYREGRVTSQPADYTGDMQLPPVQNTKG